MTRSVSPSTIDGEARAPASKSVMQRAAAAALLAGRKPTRILNPSYAEDGLAALRVIEGLGAEVTAGPSEVVVSGGLSPRTAELDCGESGLCLRLFSAIAALWPGPLLLTGGASLLARPADMIEAPLRALGAECGTNGGRPPVAIRGPLRGGRAEVDGSVSSQFLSGLLMALPLAEHDSLITVKDLKSRPYVDMTLGLIRGLGITVVNEGDRMFRVPGRQDYEARDIVVEGDWSGAAPLLVAGALAGRATVTGLDLSSPQADRRVLEALLAAGAVVGESGGRVTAAKGTLKGFSFDATDCPDLFPPLVALACHCAGTTRIAGASRLRHKESDRAQALSEEFGRLGARVQAGGDEIEVSGGPLEGGTAGARGDHRIAMALAAAAVAARGPVRIEGAECVAKSYPAFFDDLAGMGGRIDG
jgi:3-phosphoshikimate 1-carboxyvinyltransferase